MIRVAHISTARSWRGAEKQIWSLLQGDTGEIDNYLFCPWGSVLYEHSLSLQKNPGFYSKRFGWDMPGAWKLKQFVKVKQIDLLHIHDSHALNLYWGARLMGLNIPVVLTRHVNFRPGNPFKYRGGHIKRIICVSRAVKETMEEVTDPGKLVTIHPGISLPSAERNGQLRELIGIDKADFLIGTVSSLEPEKDLPAFIRIIQGVIKHYPKVQAVIIGDGSLRDSLKKQVRQAGLEKSIHFTGFKNNIDKILPDLDLFLFTSGTEGFGLAPAEAMLANVPVIARHCEAIYEVLNGGRYGQIFHSEAEGINNIIELIEDPELRQKWAGVGRDQAMKFSVVQLIEKTHNLYREILR